MYIHNAQTKGTYCKPMVESVSSGDAVKEIFSSRDLRMRVQVCLSVFTAITFEPLSLETSFMVCRFIMTISRSS